MAKLQTLRQSSAAIFTFIAAIAACVVVMVLLMRVGFMDFAQSLVLTAVLLFGLVMLQRLIETSRTEASFKAELERLSAKVDELSFSKDDDASIKSLTHLATLEERVADLEVIRAEQTQVQNAPLETRTANDVRSAQSETAQPAKPGREVLGDLTDDNLNMHLQPVVSLPGKSPVYFESFMRLRLSNDNYLDNHQFQRLLQDGGLVPMVEKKLLFSTLRMLRKMGNMKNRAGFFCPLSVDSLTSARVYQPFYRLLEANTDLQESLIIGFAQRDYNRLTQEQLEHLAGISERGYSLSLDEVVDLDIDPVELAKMGFRYMKVPAAILLRTDLTAKDGFASPSELSTKLGEHGITLIATEIARDEDVPALMGLNIRFGHGSVFAPPRPVKSDLLNPAGAKKPAQPEVQRLVEEA